MSMGTGLRCPAATCSHRRPLPPRARSWPDSGPGIDAADLPFIFEKFYRGRKNSARGKGTAMGLAIVRAILAAHGGEIDVVSQPGHGAAFRFWVPLLEKQPAPAEEQIIEQA